MIVMFMISISCSIFNIQHHQYMQCSQCSQVVLRKNRAVQLLCGGRHQKQALGHQVKNLCESQKN